MDVTFHVEAGISSFIVSSNHGDFVMAQTSRKQVNMSTILKGRLPCYW